MPNKISLVINFFSPGFPGGSADKKKKIFLQCRRPEFSPWVGKIHWRGYDNPLQYSCLENSMDYHGVAESQTLLSDFQFHFLCQIRVVLNLHLCSITHLKSFSYLKANSTKIDPTREISGLAFIYKLKKPVLCEEET